MTMTRVIAKSALVALWPYIKKFGNWPVGAHVIRFAIGVDKHQPVYYCELHQWRTVLSSMVQCKGTNTVFSNNYKRRPRIPGSVASFIYIMYNAQETR